MCILKGCAGSLVYTDFIKLYYYIIMDNSCKWRVYSCTDRQKCGWKIFYCMSYLFCDTAEIFMTNVESFNTLKYHDFILLTVIRHMFFLSFLQNYWVFFISGGLISSIHSSLNKGSGIKSITHITYDDCWWHCVVKKGISESIKTTWIIVVDLIK